MKMMITNQLLLYILCILYLNFLWVMIWNPFWAPSPLRLFRASMQASFLRVLLLSNPFRTPTPSIPIRTSSSPSLPCMQSSVWFLVVQLLTPTVIILILLMHVITLNWSRPEYWANTRFMKVMKPFVMLMIMYNCKMSM